MSNKPTEKIVIIGTGPAGLTAAIYAARAGFSPVVYAGLLHGGQLTTTSHVENFPGFKDPIMGPDLMNAMTAQAERVGARIIYENINSVNFSCRPFQLTTDKTQVSAETVIIATGASSRMLGLPEETSLMGRGLSTCATCDGFFFRGKKVGVVGGGDSAMEEALYLANICEKVFLIHRNENFRASKIMLERARAHAKIEFMLPFAVTKLESDDSGLSGVRLRNTSSHEVIRLPLDGLFYGIGHEPNSKIFEAYLELDEHRYIKVNAATKTNVRGVFAAGDIADPTFKQAITAAGMGCQAALEATKFLQEEA